jgi:hypothetical protein
MTASAVSLLKLSLSAAFIAMVALLAAGAAYALRLRCEGFGCSGVGILWIAWSAAYVGTAVAGTALRSTLPYGAQVRRIVSAGLLALGDTGCCIVRGRASLATSERGFAALLDGTANVRTLAGRCNSTLLKPMNPR